MKDTREYAIGYDDCMIGVEPVTDDERYMAGYQAAQEAKQIIADAGATLTVTVPVD